MKKLLVSLAIAGGLVFSAPSFAQIFPVATPAQAVPYVAAVAPTGVYFCPMGWTLVNYPSGQYVTYYVTAYQPVCSIFGCYYQPVMTPQVYWVPSNISYCVPGYTIYPGVYTK